MLLLDDFVENGLLEGQFLSDDLVLSEVVLYFGGFGQFGHIIDAFEFRSHFFDDVRAISGNEAAKVRIIDDQDMRDPKDNEQLGQHLLDVLLLIRHAGAL